MDEDRPQAARTGYTIGDALDTLSIAEFDERLDRLRAEIRRLEAAKAQKLLAAEQAHSVFGQPR